MTDWVAVAGELGSRFAERAGVHDAGDDFVADNYGELRKHRLFSAGVPAALGGGGATHAELAAMLQTLGRSCGSTALALSMHTHLVALAAWRWHREPAPVEPLLRRVAAEELVLISTGGSDWLASSGRAERVDGGWRVSGRKIFASGCPAGDVLMTSAVTHDLEGGPTVLHFPVPMSSVRVLDTWHTLGMRGSGSHDVVLEDVFVPDAAVGVRRPVNAWHPLFHAIVMIALPLIYAVYVGIAEAARDVALREARRKGDVRDLELLVGEMETELALARGMHARMIDTAAVSTPGPDTTNTIAMARTLVGRAAIRTVEKAMEVVGGASFYRALSLERMFRDVQGARFHPLQEKPQFRYSGRFALGRDLDG
jgi:acyl-CoA dehydrogenase